MVEESPGQSRPDSQLAIVQARAWHAIAHSRNYYVMHSRLPASDSEGFSIESIGGREIAALRHQRREVSQRLL